MTFDENTYQISVSQYDFGVPIVFDAGAAEGFHTGEQIVFVFATDKIDDKIFDVVLDEEEKYQFSMAFTEAEANALFDFAVKCDMTIKYSIKRNKWNAEQEKYEFLESLENEQGESMYKLIVKRTVRYNGENQSA